MRESGRLMHPDYKARISELLEKIGKKSGLPGSEIILGPTYRAITSRGVGLRINTFSINYTDVANDKKKNYYLIARDENGDVVGHLSGDFRFAADNIVGEYILATRGISVVGSEIATAYRGEGFARPLSLAHRDFLQREANRLGYPVRYKLTNANVVARDFAQQDYLANPTELNRRVRDVAAAEQKRWQSLWGQQPDVRMYYPQRGIRRVVNPKEIYIEAPRNGDLTPIIRAEISEDRTNSERLAQFNEILAALNAVVV